jgi:hypothetical protein
MNFHSSPISQLLILGLFMNTVLAETPAKLKFKTYSGYFVSNEFEPDSPASFLVLDNRKQFDQVFGVAFVIGDKSPRLAHDAFNAQLVLAAIRRGKAFCSYQVDSVTEQDGVLQLRYKTNSKKSESATFACPLILSIPKGKYQAVEFYENDKLVKRLAIVGK